MKIQALLLCAFLLTFFYGESSSLAIKEVPKSPIQALLEDVLLREQGNVRVKRGMKEDIEKGFKEFSDKVSKLPDQLTGTIKKFFDERGISMEAIQKILGDIYDSVSKLIEEVKKAMN